MFSDYVATVAISDPIAVTAKLALTGSNYHDGGIFCTCPELGFEGADMIYCRYALSIPFLKVRDDDKVLIRPTIGEDERWFYTGLVDCAGATPTTGTQFIINNDTGTFDITIGTMSINIDSILGTFDLIASATCKIEMDTTANKITLTAGTNAIILDGTANKITLNGKNLEVLV